MRTSLLILLALACVTACSATRYVATPSAKVTLTAAADVNPDPVGRASPVEVRIYELSDRAVFDALDFYAAWDNAEAVLSRQLLSSASMMMMPKESRQLRIELHSEAAFVALVVAYRDIDHAKWKLVYDVNSDWFQHHRIRLASNTIELMRNSVKPNEQNERRTQ